jgi:carbon-monoxide dehydrogenase medium subunit
MVRLAQIERSAVVREAAPVIADTLLTHSNVRVRNVATVGGNLAHGDPHMDLPPVLIALGASVRVVAGPRGPNRDTGKSHIPLMPEGCGQYE